MAQIGISPTLTKGVVVSSHTFIEGTTYANAIHQLQANYRAGHCPDQPTIEVDGIKIVRAFTMKENLEARLSEFETQQNADGSARSWDDRVHLFLNYLDGCTGIGYQRGTTKFKIVPICRELITIARGFNESFLPVSYTTLSGVELDTSKGKYNDLLTKGEVLNHEGWRATAEDDVALLTGYRNAVWSIITARNKGTTPNKAMVFWPRTWITTDELRALCMDSVGSSSDVVGYDSLNSDARLLQRTPRRRAP